MVGAENSSDGPVGSFKFTTTHWSVVANLAQRDTPEFTMAFENLCRAYWYPLYAHVRQRGHPPPEAQDLTQGFFLHLLERKPFLGLHPAKGRFRSFLLAAVDLFLADQRARQCAQKRGGGRELLPLDATEAEARYRLEPTDDRSPDRLFERRWALALLDQVLVRLQQEYAASGRAELFRQLEPFLVEGAQARPWGDVASELGLTEDAVKKAVQRLRHRYGLLFREEVAQTLADPAEIEDELRHLREVLSG
jgi:RNA polymerase sigma-70 factor (ECF subfamily)